MGKGRPIADFGLRISDSQKTLRKHARGHANPQSEIRIPQSLHCPLETFNIQYTWDAFDGVDDFVEMFDVEDFDRDFNVALLVGSDRGASIADASLHVRNC